MNILFFVIQLLRNQIYLNTTNHISIRGQITPEVANQFVYDSLTMPNVKYIYIDSLGGSVYHGNLIIDEVLQKNYTCIADRAMSMGFAIFQACRFRIVMKTSELMQHQASLTINGELEQIKNWMSMNDNRLQDLISLQAKKLNVQKEWFINKTKTEWHMTGKYAVKNNCADLLLAVSCTSVLTKQNITKISDNILLEHQYNPKLIEIYSKCPKLHEPLFTAQITIK